MQTSPTLTRPDTSIASSGFRNDINGLRAWAVTAVILYHFGIPGFNGGFVGVDVFFVISGFLMTSIIIRGLERGSFSILDFYVARAKRIVPALAVLCCTLLILGWLTLLPPDYHMLGTHVCYVLAFLSNIAFWKEAGYFDVASHEKWLLHTWSLSVEWQFYLLLPIVLALVWRFSRSRTAQLRTVFVGVVLSLCASVIATRSNPTLAFYLLPTRAWEMQAGGLVFFLASPSRLSNMTRRTMEGVGLVSIVAAILLFDRDSAWPGWRAVLPVVAAALCIAAQRTSIWTGNFFAQWLGDRSYSLYLWHWPIFVALYYLERINDANWVLAGLAATLALGHCSYVWIENPTRRMLGRVTSKRAAMGIAVSAGAVLACGLAVHQQHGVVGRFPAKVERVADAANDVNPRRDACHIAARETSPSCIYGGSTRQVLIIGDSHASSLVTSLAAAAPDRDAGVMQWTHSGCVFAPGMKIVPARSANAGEDIKCTEFNDWVKAQLASTPSQLPVVVGGHYAGSAFGRNEGRFGHDTPVVYFSRVYSTTTPAFLHEFSKKITDTACELAKQRTVYLVRPIPEMGVDVPKALSRRMAVGLKEEISISLADYRQRNAWVWAAQDEARDRCGIKILDPLPYLCDGARCYGSKNGYPLYHDDNHLSESGNKLLIPMFAQVFKERQAQAAAAAAGQD